MDPIEIIYQLRRLGKSQSQLARELDVSNGVVSNVIHNRITAYAVAAHIATLLKRNVTELWPERYVFKPRGRAAQRDKSNSTKLNSEGGAS